MQEAQQMRLVAERNCEDLSRELLGHKDKVQTLQNQLDMLRAEHQALEVICNLLTYRFYYRIKMRNNNKIYFSIGRKGYRIWKVWGNGKKMQRTATRKWENEKHVGTIWGTRDTATEAHRWKNAWEHAIVLDVGAGTWHCFMMKFLVRTKTSFLSH